MSKRRSGLLINKKCTVIPLTNTCQICNITPSLYSCKLCERITCFKDTFICNKNHYCKICYFDYEVNNFIILDILDNGKSTNMKTMLNKLRLFFSFEWIYKVFKR